jgi:hypothetical protein
MLFGFDQLGVALATGQKRGGRKDSDEQQANNETRS